MRGDELLVATSLSIPIYNQAGTNIIAPPIPKTPPVKPAAKLRNWVLLKNFYDILSYSLLNTKPRFSFKVSF